VHSLVKLRLLGRGLGSRTLADFPGVHLREQK
jgi:hypothetical protein